MKSSSGGGGGGGGDSGAGGESFESPATTRTLESVEAEEFERKKKQQQDETNDKKSSTTSSNLTASASAATKEDSNKDNNSTKSTLNPKETSHSVRRVGAGKQQRPLRPNLRRQVIVRGETSTSVPVINARPIELATILPAGAISMTAGPPKRPAHLPARYIVPAAPASIVPTNSLGAATTTVTGAPNQTSSSKPNRYAAWAQVQHWQAAAAAAAAAHQQQQVLTTSGGASVGSPGDHHNHLGFQHHFSSAASRVLVVNPMHIVNISKHTKSRLIKSIEAIKRFSEKWFSHVLLLLFLAIYACFGAYIFISFEAPTENWEKQFIIDTRLRIVNESWVEASSKSKEDFLDSIRYKLEDYERILNRACASGMSSNSLENQWTFWGALFYSMTVFTTIGYGHLTPITFAGRVATMVYAIFGIPILLMVLADLGKLLTRIIKYAFKKFRYLYNKLFKKNKTSQRTRKLISDNTNQYIGFARRNLERGVATYIQPNYQRIPKAVGLLRQKFWFANKDLQDAVSIQKLEEDRETTKENKVEGGGGGGGEGELETKVNIESNDINLLDNNSIGKNRTVSSELIITPNKQSKPVSPQASDRKEHPLGNSHHNNQHHHHHHQHHHHHHHQHNQNDHQHTKKSLERNNKRKVSNAGSAKSAKQTTNNPKSSLLRSNSSSLIPNSNSNSNVPSTTAPVSSIPIKKLEAIQMTGNNENELLKTNPNEARMKAFHSITSKDSSLTGDNFPLPASNQANNDVENVAENYVDDVDDVDDLEGLEDGEEDGEEVEEEEEEDFDIPVSFAVFLLIVYMMFGAVIFSIWEGWNFFDSLYFVFISMSTIGFGDLVPQHPKRMIGTFIYLLFGLALTSMCINVVQEKIHATFLRAKMQIGEKMGFDLDQIMADDYYGSMDTNGCVDEDCESHSIAMSQTNSTSQHLQHSNANHQKDLHSSLSGEIVQGGGGGGGGGDLSANVKPESQPTESGSQLSKSKESLKMKKRNVASLPGHNNHSGGGGASSASASFRRKPSKRISRQPTPSPLNSNITTQQTNTINQLAPSTTLLQHSTSSNLQQKAIKSDLEVIRNDQQLAVTSVASSAHDCQLASKQVADVSNYVIENSNSMTPKYPTVNIKGVCEPLTSGIQANPVIRQQQMVKSRSSELPLQIGQPYRYDSSTSAATFRSSNLLGGGGGGKLAAPGRRSAGSSRRSSVSQELNQLDDLIMALKSQAKEQSRFAPLLGISRSNSRH